MTNNESVLTGGLTASQWVELLNGDEAKQAHKALCYFDGEQEELMVKLLSDPNRGRRKWQERGIIPRYRNLTKMIVEKSGMLFKDKPPEFEIYVGNSDVEDEAQTKKLADELYKTEWVETFTNLDQVVRLLKTGLVLVQYNKDEGQLVFDILTRANAQVLINPSTRAVESLIYRTSDCGDTETFRIITPLLVIDLLKVKEKVTVVNSEPNPHGIVPVATFYDTNVPRNGFWAPASYDIVSMNEMVNLHLTDSEYAISWAKLPTLFTNMKFQNDEVETYSIEQIGTNALPRMVPSQESLLGGPSRAIMMDSAGVDSPFIKYESPKVDIAPLDEVVDGWIKAFAEDWSVKISGKDNSRATSGFQLLVEEIDNLDLRKRRQRMFEAGFKRFFKVLTAVMNTIKPGYFNDNAELFVDFPDPFLPVDTKEQEEVWTARIAEGRASDVDYFVEVHGLSRTEAEEKVREVIEDQKKKEWLKATISIDPKTGEAVETEPEQPEASADPLVEPDDEEA